MFDRLVETAKALKPPKSDQNFHTTFLLKGKRVIAIGINSVKTHPRNLKLDYYNRSGEHMGGYCGTHSELDAVLKYGQDDLRNITFVNVRIGRSGQLANSRPCRGCQSLIKQVGAKKVYYSNNNTFEQL